MTVSIYGEEKSFYKLIAEEAPAWRRREFEAWYSRAQDSYAGGDAWRAADNLLDALCYDGDVGSADRLLQYLASAGALAALAEDAQALVDHLRTSGGAYSLRQVKLVAKLQHRLRSLSGWADEDADTAQRRSEAEWAQAFKGLLAEGGLPLSSGAMDEARLAEVTELFEQMLAAPDAAEELLLKAVREAGASDEKVEQVRAVAGMMAQEMAAMFAGARGASDDKADDADEDESDDWDLDEDKTLTAYAHAMGEIRRLLNARPLVYSPELAPLWRGLLENPQMRAQFDLWALDDLWHAGNLALNAFDATEARPALDDAVYLLRRLAARAAELGDSDDGYTESLVMALDRYYDVTQDEAILREIAALGRGA